MLSVDKRLMEDLVVQLPLDPVRIRSIEMLARSKKLCQALPAKRTFGKLAVDPRQNRSPSVDGEKARPRPTATAALRA